MVGGDLDLRGTGLQVSAKSPTTASSGLRTRRSVAQRSVRYHCSSPTVNLRQHHGEIDGRKRFVIADTSVGCLIASWALE